MEDGHGDDDALGLADTKLGGAAAEKFDVVGEAHAGECGADGGGAFFARASGVSAPGLPPLRAATQSAYEGNVRDLQDEWGCAGGEGPDQRLGGCGEIVAL